MDINNLPPDLTPDKPKRKDFRTLSAYREALRQWEARDLVWVERQLLHDDPLRQLVTEFGSIIREAKAKFESGDGVGPRQAAKLLVAGFKKACELGRKTTVHDLGSAEEFDKAIKALADLYLKWFVNQCRSAVSDEAERELSQELERRLLKVRRRMQVRAWGSLRRRPEALGATPGSADSLKLTQEGNVQPSGVLPAAAPKRPPLTKQQVDSDRRESVILPLLEEKGWTPHQWAQKAGVNPNVVYDYLSGKSFPGRIKRQKLEQAIGLKPLPR